MKVCIINTERTHGKRYQIMSRDDYGFTHIYPGKLFDLEQAIDICNKNNFNILNIGTMWECLKK